MDDGLIQVLVIAVFVILSMMDGAAREAAEKSADLRTSPGESPADSRRDCCLVGERRRSG